MLYHILFVGILSNSILSSISFRFDASLFRPKSLVVRARVGVRNVPLAQSSLRLPNCIPLLHGNSISGYEKVGSHFTILRGVSEVTHIFPLHPGALSNDATGFVIKESTIGAFPVPMENSMVLINVRPTSSSSAWLYIWIVCHGVYSPLEKQKQEVFVRSLIKEFADNSRRALGVAHCRNRPTVSGLCNHATNPLFGTSMQPLMHPVPLNRPNPKKLLAITPNVREVSDTLVKSSHRTAAPFDVNMLFVVFGQFLDHDIVLTPTDHTSKDSTSQILNPTTGLSMNFARSATLQYSYSDCCEKPYSDKSVWEGPPFNRITSFIDGGTVYGSNHLRANVLRMFRDGEIDMKQNGDEMFLPLNHPEHLLFQLHNEPNNEDTTLFVAGDERSNENILLTAVHTLFSREHNRVCRLLHSWLVSKGKSGKELLKDDWMYLAARMIVTAEIQSVVYNDFLPLLLGKDALPPYKGYDPNVDARISTLHSSFAYRWGHSAVWESYNFKDRSGKRLRFQLRDLFFNPKLFVQIGVRGISDTMIVTSASDVDEQVIDSLRDVLFNPPGKHVLDLVSLNMHRARDLGIPGYLDLQKQFGTGSGLNNIKPDLRDRLVRAYGDTEKIDPFIGGLSEEKKNGSLLGPLFWEINRDQFLRLRDGDRFFYKNMKWPAIIKDMPLVKHIMSDKWLMKDVVLANSGMTESEFKGDISAFKTSSRA